MIELQNRVSKALENGFPFVVYCKDYKKPITGFFQKDSKTEYASNLDRKGYVFAPFDDTNETLIIPYSKSDKIEFEPLKSKRSERETTFSIPSEAAKKFHKNLVEKAVYFIQNSDVDKVVLSRKECVESSSIPLVDTFYRLCENYSSAYVYFWYHPASGIWMGATPERLLLVRNHKINVMALAATQEYIGTLQVEWGAKEQQEHQYVVDYISSKIKDLNIQISETYTVKSGNLLHLRADINGEIPRGKNVLAPLIRTLHPTPATCGLPKEASKTFIVDNEAYNREYYTGFLGEMNDGAVDLFVNLRCMKIDRDGHRICIFVGGGITKDSDPEKEWLETVIKSQVMKKVL